MNKNVRSDVNEFNNLLTAMRKVPGAKIDVAYDQNNELIGVYYQDARMAALFESYPEIIVFDTTYKLNDRRMPLFLMMIVDGAGETEVACLWIIRSDSKAAAESMLDAFKSHNENWSKIKVVISKYKYFILNICIIKKNYYN